MSKLVHEPERTFIYKDPKTGLIEVVDILTGDVLAKQDTPFSQISETDHGGKYLYNPAVAEVICQRVSEGASLTAVCKLNGMPGLFIVAQWRKRHPEFTDALNEARRLRAEVHRDKAAELLEGHYSKDEVPASKFKFDGHLKLASHDSPDVYGNRQKVELSGTGEIILDTGVRREGDPGYHRDESIDVTDLTSTPDVEEIEDAETQAKTEATEKVDERT